MARGHLRLTLEMRMTQVYNAVRRRGMASLSEISDDVQLSKKSGRLRYILTALEDEGALQSTLLNMSNGWVIRYWFSPLDKPRLGGF